MTIGIISEDKNDCDALGAIVKKILGNSVKIVPAHKTGKDAIIHQKKLLASKVFNFGCEAVLIVRDSDGGQLEKIITSLRDAYDSTSIRSAYSICIAVEELEAWFLGDVDCVRATYNLPSNSSRISESNVDDIHDPKERLKTYIIKESRGKAQYIPSDTARMAEKINIETALTKSKSFSYFFNTVVSL
jgi:hypothetical protein